MMLRNHQMIELGLCARRIEPLLNMLKRALRDRSRNLPLACASPDDVMRCATATSSASRTVFREYAQFAAKARSLGRREIRTGIPSTGFSQKQCVDHDLHRCRPRLIQAQAHASSREFIRKSPFRPVPLTASAAWLPTGYIVTVTGNGQKCRSDESAPRLKRAWRRCVSLFPAGAVAAGAGAMVSQTFLVQTIGLIVLIHLKVPMVFSP